MKMSIYSKELISFGKFLTILIRIHTNINYVKIFFHLIIARYY